MWNQEEIAELQQKLAELKDRSRCLEQQIQQEEQQVEVEELEGSVLRSCSVAQLRDMSRTLQDLVTSDNRMQISVSPPPSMLRSVRCGRLFNLLLRCSYSRPASLGEKKCKYIFRVEIALWNAVKKHFHTWSICILHPGVSGFLPLATRPYIRLAEPESLSHSNCEEDLLTGLLYAFPSLSRVGWS